MLPAAVVGVLGTVGATVGSVLLKMLLKSLSARATEKLVLLGLRKLSEHTESKVDDEVYKIVQEAVEGPTEHSLPSDVE
jgi:hypothetical protein